MGNRVIEKKIAVLECPPSIVEKDPYKIALLDCDSLEIARQITLMTWEKWVAIQPSEFLGLEFTKKGGKAEHGTHSGPLHCIDILL